MLKALGSHKTVARFKHIRDPVLRDISETSDEVLRYRHRHLSAGRETWHKVGTAIAVKKGIPRTCANVPTLLSSVATGVCTPRGNTAAMSLAAVYKSLEIL
jgi:hypothetical protein